MREREREREREGGKRVKPQESSFMHKLSYKCTYRRAFSFVRATASSDWSTAYPLRPGLSWRREIDMAPLPQHRSRKVRLPESPPSLFLSFSQLLGFVVEWPQQWSSTKSTSTWWEGQREREGGRDGEERREREGGMERRERL